MNDSALQMIKKGFRMKHAVILGLFLIMICVAFSIFSDPAEAKTKVNVKVGNKIFNGVFYDNPTSRALMKKMPLSYRMADLNGNEKYKYLDYSLPVNEKPVKRIKTGDIMLYGDDCLVVFYKSFKTSYEYTRIGRITNTKELKKAAGKGKVIVKISKKKKIALNKKSLIMNVGQTAKLKLNGAQKAKVKWKSSNKNIVTVYKGKVKANKSGRAKVTATYKNKKYICRITVRQSETEKTETPEDPEQKANEGEGESQPDEPKADDQPVEDPVKKELNLYVDDTKLSVLWKDNDSVSKLKEIAEKSPIEIKMSRYGGFEQVGHIGESLPREDVKITTNPGDIVLYSGNQMVIFYGSNNWEYTKLGHIENMTTAELASLFSGTDRTVRITME